LISINGEVDMLFATRFAALILAALTFGLSFAYMLASGPRMAWAPELWMNATAFGGQAALIGLVTMIVDPLAVLATALVAYLIRRRGPVMATSLAAALLLAAALVWWVISVQPMNETMAAWPRGDVPADFEAVRAQWESGHAVTAILKLLAFAALAFSVLLETDGRTVRR
jgi:hypothetical protein